MQHDPSETVETVKVVAPVVDGNPYGYIVINRADLTPEHHVFDEAPKDAPRRKPAKGA